MQLSNGNPKIERSLLLSQEVLHVEEVLAASCEGNSLSQTRCCHVTVPTLQL